MGYSHAQMVIESNPNRARIFFLKYHENQTLFAYSEVKHNALWILILNYWKSSLKETSVIEQGHRLVQFYKI
jgi:hypothetical protein